MRRRELMAAALVATGGSIAACSSLPPAQSAALAGVVVQAVRAGHGTPAIVLQSGLGDDASPWAKVFDELAREREVVAVERPGYAGAPATQGLRDPCTIAAEQRALLRHLGLKPPYLLVGHSLGGRYQWVYAALYPDEVSGLVLLEATHPEHWPRMQRDAPAMAATVSALRLAFGATMKREFDDQDLCLAERIGPAQIAALKRIPARVLARANYPLAERGRFEAMHRQTQRDWLGLTGAGQLQLVTGSGHYLQRDRPDVVVSAVRSLLAAD